jgi:hypothetical protein
MHKTMKIISYEMWNLNANLHVTGVKKTNLNLIFKKRNGQIAKTYSVISNYFCYK